MLRLKQMLAFSFVALAIGGALKFASTADRGARAATNEIYRTATENPEFGAYAKMAALALEKPDDSLLMPVQGVRVRQVSDTWGAARDGGRSHQGQDIFAKKGTAVYSATDGYVLRVGESDLGGKTVFVLGAGGRRYYYAHLDAFAPDLKAGDWVSRDTLLGYVGATGNARGTPPHLHFGVYAADGWSRGAVNPLPLLKDRP